MKQREPTDEDRVAVARLSAVAARFKGDQSTYELTESSPDPLGEPKATEEEAFAQAKAAEQPVVSEEPDEPGQWRPSGIADQSDERKESDPAQERDTNE